LTAWAEPLQDGSIRAFDYSKPQDVYAKIPSLMTLLPVPGELAGQKRAFGFLSAVEHLRHQPAFSSIAYSRYGDYKGAWSVASGQTTQEIADATALANCETYRKTNKPDAPVCEIYRRKDGKLISQTDGLQEVQKSDAANRIAAGQNCLGEAQFRSTNSNVSATVDFENQSGQAVKIFWITYKGERQLFKELASAQSYRQQTYLAHPWVIADSADKCLQVFTPGSPSAKVVIN
jgi:VHL beta domain